MGPVHARLHDSRGRFWVTPLWVLGALTTFVVGIASSNVALGTLTPLLLSVGPFLNWRRRTREGLLQIAPGEVIMEGAPAISTKQVRGATSTRTARGVALMLATTEDGGSPVTLEFDNDAAAAEVRRALGLGHDGFGALTWASSAGEGAAGRTVFRVASGILFASATLIAFAAGFGGEESGWWSLYTAAVTFGCMSLFLAFVLTIAGWYRPTLKLDAQGAARVPWSHIKDVKIDGSTLWIAARGRPHEGAEVQQQNVSHPLATSRWDRRAMSDTDATLLLSAIRDGAQRAHGLGPRKQEIAARMDTLQRGSEPARDWLARLDMAAQTVLGGYRGSTLEKDDLYTLLEDPDADIHMRAGAARVLLRVDPAAAQIRVEDAIAAIRDPEHEKRIRLATRSDVDSAGEALDEMTESLVAVQRL
jgi:hypothetical protein